jgi:hypothetical protein
MRFLLTESIQTEKGLPLIYEIQIQCQGENYENNGHVEINDLRGLEPTAEFKKVGGSKKSKARDKCERIGQNVFNDFRSKSLTKKESPAELVGMQGSLPATSTRNDSLVHVPPAMCFDVV